MKGVFLVSSIFAEFMFHYCNARLTINAGPIDLVEMSSMHMEKLSGNVDFARNQIWSFGVTG